jgi:D-cysteine desulfhydrase
LPICEHAPGLAARPFLSLVARPTPVHRIEGHAERLWVKRDDRVSERYGGNKVRRWEWLLAHARERGTRTLITVGGTGSTQVTSLCAHGVGNGFEVVGVLFDQPPSPFVDEALALGARFGGKLVRAGGYAGAALATLRASRQAERPAIIAPGASGPLGNLAYVDAMLELGAQVQRGALPRPDRIVVACASPSCWSPTR